MPPSPRLGEPLIEPLLTPQFCFNTTALRDFLRLSRATVDDSISAQLNALLTPSSSNPYSLDAPNRAPQSPPARGTSRRAIPSDTCSAFKSQILFPSWSARSNVLSYCRQVGSSAENDSRFMSGAPTTAQVADGASPTENSTTSAAAARNPRNYWGREQVVDERLDPYSARDYEWTRSTKAQDLEEVLRNEEGVERIVRARTLRVLLDRCGNTVSAARMSEGDGEEEWRAWKRRKEDEAR